MASVYVLSSSDKPTVIRYVGITKYDTCDKRFLAHLDRAKSGSNLPVHCWIRNRISRGIDITAKEIATNLTWEDACAFEIETIRLFRLSDNCELLNLTAGGEGSLGFRQSEESIAKKSASLRGKVTSEETKQKISKANTGKTRSPEARRKISDAKRGKKLSESHKQKIAKSLQGRECSEETREKIARPQRGRVFSESHIENIKKARRARSERERLEKERRKNESE